MTKNIGSTALCLLMSLAFCLSSQASVITEKLEGLTLRSVAYSDDSFTFLLRNDTHVVVIKVKDKAGMWAQAPVSTGSRIQQDLAATKMMSSVDHVGEAFTLDSTDCNALITVINQFIKTKFEPDELKSIASIPKDELKSRHTSALLAIKAKRTLSHHLAAEGKRIHVVKKGDTLWRIATEYYDDGTLWQLIKEANPHTLGNSGKISVGDELIIP